MTAVRTSRVPYEPGDHGRMVYLILESCGERGTAECALGGLRRTGKEPLVEGEEVGICKPESTFRTVRRLTKNAGFLPLTHYIDTAIQALSRRTTVKITLNSRKHSLRASPPRSLKATSNKSRGGCRRRHGSANLLSPTHSVSSTNVSSQSRCGAI